MKNTELNYDRIYRALHDGLCLSGRAAAYVTRATLARHGLPATQGRTTAGEHCAEHGLDGSPKTQETLAKLAKYSAEQLNECVRLLCDYVAARDTRAVAQLREKDALAAIEKWKANPQTAAERETAEIAARDEWWEREGRWECELEERGESKNYWHERDCAERNGAELSARDYCAGVTADDAIEREDS